MDAPQQNGGDQAQKRFACVLFAWEIACVLPQCDSNYPQKRHGEGVLDEDVLVEHHTLHKTKRTDELLSFHQEGGVLQGILAHKKRTDELFSFPQEESTGAGGNQYVACNRTTKTEGGNSHSIPAHNARARSIDLQDRTSDDEDEDAVLQETEGEHNSGAPPHAGPIPDIDCCCADS